MWVLAQEVQMMLRKRILLLGLVLVFTWLFTGCEADDPLMDSLYTDNIFAGSAGLDIGSIGEPYENIYVNNIVGPGGGGDVTAAANLTSDMIVRGDGGLKGIKTSIVSIDNFGNIITPNDIDGFDINAANDLSCINDLDVTDDADVGGNLDVTDEFTVGGYSILGAGAPLLATPDGSLYAFSNLVSEAALMGAATPWRSGLWVGEDTVIAVEHSSNCDFDLTGGAYENLLTADDAVFLQADADLNNFIILTSGVHAGGGAEIIQFIDTTHVVVKTFGWDSDLTNIDFIVTPHPTLVAGNGNEVGVNALSAGGFHVGSYDYTEGCLFTVELDIAVDDASAICVEVAANGFSASEAMRVRYNTGDLQPTDVLSVLKISLDDTEAVNSDSTTHIDFIELLTTDTEDAKKHGIHVGQSFDSAFSVSGGTEEDPDYGYTVVPDVATDRVTGAPGAGTAFLEASAGNVEIFSADNDYVLIGSDAMFEAVDALLLTPSNRDVAEEYYYSTGVGTWSPLIVSDTVNGFQQSGTITFNAPATWALTNATVPAGAAITNAYYIKIVRTRNNVGSPPVEDYFKTFTSSSLTDFQIRGDGTVRPVEMADAAAPNNSLYYSTTQSKLVYKDSGGVVRDLW